MTKNRPLFFSLAAGAAVCLILRVMLKLTAVDPATGFYEGGGALPLVFNILLGVSVLLLLAAGYLSGRRMRGASVTFTIPLRALSIAAGAALFCWTLLRLKELSEVLFRRLPAHAQAAHLLLHPPLPAGPALDQRLSFLPGRGRRALHDPLRIPRFYGRTRPPACAKRASTSREVCAPCG